MKILHLIYSLSSGGAEKFVVNLANEQARIGHDVTVMMLRDADNNDLAFNRKFLNDNVRFIGLNFKSGISPTMIYKACKAVKCVSPDIVHAHLNVIPFVFPLVIGPSKIKFVQTLHNIASRAMGSTYQYEINRLLYRTGLVTPVTISDQCNQSYREFYNLDNARYVDNGTVHVSPSADFDAVKKEVESLKPNSETRVMIHLGRCFPQKNQRMLVEAFNKVVDEGMDAILLILGSGFDSEEGQQLKSMACDKIHFLGLKSNVGDYLLNSQYFCLSSNYEGLPISLIEAMSAGCTPICTAVGGVPDVINDPSIGYLSSDVSTSTYAETLRKAYNAPLDRTVIRKNFEQRFSIAKCASEYDEVYKSILKR